MQAAFQLASVHGMLYTGGNVRFSGDGAQLYSPVHNHLSCLQLRHEGHTSLTCSNSTIQCFDVSPDEDLVLAIGERGLGFFYSLSARVVLDTVALPPDCSVAAVRFSPCGRFAAVAVETTLHIFAAPARRVVRFHACPRVAQLHALLSRPITCLDWSGDSAHVLVSGQDARMKIVPRHAYASLGAGAQHNHLIGHRRAVIGAWFADKDESNSSSSSSGGARVVSVGSDNVVMTWVRTTMTRQEVMRAIAQASVNARCRAAAAANADEDNDDDDDEDAVPRSILERQRVEQLRRDGVRVSAADVSFLPPMLRDAYVIEHKFLLTHKGRPSVATLHAARGLLAIGYDSGIFAIHTLPETTRSAAGNTTNNNNNDDEDDHNNDDNSSNKAQRAQAELPLVHLLSISAQSLTAAAFSPSGDHIAFASAHLRQLLVWDWRGEAYVLKEQAHYYDIARTAITADASAIVSGGDDGKVKVWKASSGQCFVTFVDHTAAITGVVTCAATNALFTCSLDGTARGWDLVRYRCFRVFVPHDEELRAFATGGSGSEAAAAASASSTTQLSCIAVDPSGELLAVGSARVNRIYLFAIQTGRVVDVLQGHEGPISCVAFHPDGTTLVSGALDTRLIVWQLFTRNDGGARLSGDGDVVDVGSEVLCVAYSSSGRCMAVLTARQEVLVYEAVVAHEPQLLKTFSVARDAVGGWHGAVGPHSSNTAQRFTRLALAPEGERVLLGGESKWLVLFHATQGYVLGKWPVSTNAQVRGVEEQYAWRRASEAGMLDDIDVADDDVHLTRRRLLELPGSRHRHYATGQRKTALVARTADVAFAATGSEFVAATTDGLLIFSLYVRRPRFAPLQLTSALTTDAVRAQLASGQQPVLALMGALLLGERALGVECVRRMPRQAIPVAVSSTPSSVYPLLVLWVAREVEESRYVEHSLLWAQSLLLHSSEALLACTGHGGGGGGGVVAATAAASSSSSSSSLQLIPALKTLLRSLHTHRTLTQLANENYFALLYLADAAAMHKHALTATANNDNKDNNTATTTTTAEATTAA